MIEYRAIALKIAQVPEKIRGYGHVKLANMDKADDETRELAAQFTARPQFIKIKRA